MAEILPVACERGCPRTLSSPKAAPIIPQFSQQRAVLPVHLSGVRLGRWRIRRDQMTRWQIALYDGHREFGTRHRQSGRAAAGLSGRADEPLAAPNTANPKPFESVA